MGKTRRRKDEAREPAPAPPSASARERIGLPIGLGLAVFFAFLPVLGAGFVNWDDDTNFEQNPHYRGLGPKNLAWMFTTFHMGHYQPLAWMSLGLDYLLWGMDARGYHLSSLLLHVANTILCYAVFLALLGRIRGEEAALPRWAAAAGALFYGLHPLRVESVAWVTERRDVLCTLFLLLAVLAYLRMERARAAGGGWARWLGLSCAAFGASLLSKALGIMLPFALLAIDVFPLRRFAPGARRGVLLEKVPYLALSVIDGVVMLLAMSHIGQVREVGAYEPGQRLLQASYGLWFYAWKTLLPFHLHPLYALADQVSLWRAEYLWPAAGTAAVMGALVAFRRRCPALPAAWLSYAILVAPVLGFAVKGFQRAADRYSYLSCIPLSFLAAAGVAALASGRRRGRIPPVAGRAAVAAVAVLLAGLGVLTFRQAGFWKDSIALWTRVLCYEQRSDLPYVNRGSARQERGDVEGALEDYTRALRVNPESADAYNNRGQLRQSRGQLDDALADYDKALALNPRMSEGYNNRAALKLARKDWDGALADAGEALKIEAGRPETYAIRAGAREAKGELDGAIADYEAALRLAAREWSHRRTVESLLNRSRVRRGVAPGSGKP